MFLSLKNALGRPYLSFVGLLDSFSGASAAYSLRKLSSSYTGNAVRIRRVSDDVEVDVGFSGNSVSTSSPITNVSGDGGDTSATTLGGFITEGGNQDATVTTWYDQSGNSRNAPQSTTGEQPIIASSGVLETDANGKPTILFDGTDDDLDLPTTVMSSLDSVSAFNVCSSSNTSDTRIALGLSRSQGSAKRHYLPVQNNDQFFHNYDAPFVPSSQKLSDVDTNQHLFSSVAGASTAKGFFDGGEAKFSQSSVSTYASNTAGGIGSTNGTANWQGDISEIIIYNSDQTSDFDAINTKIKSYYGIS
jgi:hypothetical protein